MCSAQLLSQEMEAKMVRRECIASIIDILTAANSDDNENNLRRIKEEFNLKMSCSSFAVLKKLIAMRRQLDTELGRKERRWRGGGSVSKKVPFAVSELKLKPVKVRVAKLPSIFIANLSRTSLAQTSATQVLKKSPPTFVAVLCKGKVTMKKPHNLVEKVRKSVTWWDGYNKLASLEATSVQNYAH